MRWSVAITVAAVVVSACTDVGSAGRDERADSGSLGNVALFCRAWPAAGDKLLGTVSGETSIRYETDVAPTDRFLADVDSTVPAEIRSEWDRAYETYQRVSDLLFITGYNENEDAIRAVHLKMAFGDAGPEAAVADTEAAAAAIDEWSEANCDAAAVTAGTSGGPGSLTVRIMPQEHLTEQRLLMALLPPGTDFAAVRSLAPIVAASCTQVEQLPEDWESWLRELAPQAAELGMDPEELVLTQFRDGEFSHPLIPIDAEQRSQPNICSAIPSEYEAEAALVPGGAYELFVGAYRGEPGSYDFYFAAPEHCLQFPVTINGDTVVDLPELEPCTLEPLGSPEEIARRAAPPVESGGTLRVEFDSALQPEGFDFCSLNAVLLPGGTTLNDIGRGDTWPSGMFNLRPLVPRFVEGEAAQRLARSPGLVPVLAMVASGQGGAMINADIRDGESWDARFPDPVALAAGSYDLRLQEMCNNEDAQDEDDGAIRCAFVTVEVDGATIVEMPELGVCA
ncbi:MAG: hypothetical protein BMS9Abin07_1792 [Acidimicrobiia bacterium]|nr:MAG: hypothetical protein BMS9Abin07_1792 [Acidimicrobiia bacterium]